MLALMVAQMLILVVTKGFQCKKLCEIIKSFLARALYRFVSEFLLLALLFVLFHNPSQIKRAGA